MKNAILALVIVGVWVVNAQTLLDFTANEGTLEPYPGPAVFRTDAVKKQVELTQDGLVVRSDSQFEQGASKWIVMGVPKKFRPAYDFSDALFRIVLKCPPSGRIMSNLAVNLSDRDGEIFQLMRHGEEYNEFGEFCVLFDLRRMPAGKKGYGTPKANAVLEPPLTIDSVALHYKSGVDELGSMGEGEAIFLRIESLERPPTESDVPRTVVSREPISTDTMYPGAAPFPGAERIVVKMEEKEGSGEGKATLTLSYGSDGPAKKGKMVSFDATVSNGVARFETKLPYRTQYEFFTLKTQPASLKPKLVVGEFVQTAAEALRFEIDTGNPLHLVRDGKNEWPAVVLRNPTADDRAWNVNFTMTDYFGKEVKFPFKGVIKARASVRFEVPRPLPARGLWRVKAAVTGDDGSHTVKEDRFGYLDLHEVTPKTEKPKFRMGIHYHGTRYLPDKVDLTISALVAAGAKFVRCDYDHMWGDIEPWQGAERWERSDLMIDKLTKAGLALDIIFAGTPSWAIPKESAEHVKRCQEQGLRTKNCSYIPREGLFREFCEKYGRRYGTKIDYYECGNEWDLTGTGTADFNDLLRVQREAYEGLHAGCKDVCVTPNGWTTSISCTNGNLKVWQNGLVEFFADHPEVYDAWALHCHGEPAMFRVNISERFLPMRAAHKLRERPWLLNETALSCANGMEDEVASAVWQKIVYGWAMGARDYIWYNLRATGWFDGGEPGYGLITADYRPRAGYAAFSALSAVAQGMDFDGTIHSKKLRHLFRFRGSSQQVKDGFALIGWDTRQKGVVCGVKVATDAKSAATVDLMGNRTPVRIVNGVVDFAIGFYPQALVLDGATKAEVVNPADLEREDVSGLVLRGKSSRPHAVLETAANVKDLYEANPAMTHRLWKGPADHSARLWFEPSDKGLRVKAVVRDDVRAEGDRMEVVIAAAATKTTVLRPVGRTGEFDSYEGVIPVSGTRFGVNVIIRDDDGEGEDSYLFLRREGEGELRVEMEK